MRVLDDFYRQILCFGLYKVRDAIHSKQFEWAEAHAEMLHNIPSLIGEKNVHRHWYYWTTERESYTDWTSGRGRSEARSHMRIFYEPIWNEMSSVIAKHVAPKVGADAIPKRTRRAISVRSKRRKR